MSKVHITLVGGQPAPVYHGIVACQPDYVIYVCSRSDVSKQTADVLREVLNEIPSKCTFLHPTDPLQIKLFAEALASQFKNDDVTVNISSGLKSWSHWFGIVFEKMSNAAVVYIDQNNVLWNYKTMQPSYNVVFDMHKLFMLYGNPLENYTPFSAYTKEDFDAIHTIEVCRRNNFTDFNQLTTVLPKGISSQVKNQVQGRYVLPNNESWVSWNKKLLDGMQEVCLCIVNKSRTRCLSERIVSPHAVNLVFSAGWFECKVARILSRWRNAKEIYVNCRFPYKPLLDKNEVDIIINTGAKILFVECKTQIFDTTAIDKFRSVVKGYGGTASKGMFVTDAEMSELAKVKCKEHGILTFSLQDEHEGKSVEEAITALLDAELYNINAR